MAQASMKEGRPVESLLAFCTAVRATARVSVYMMLRPIAEDVSVLVSTEASAVMTTAGASGAFCLQDMSN